MGDTSPLSPPYVYILLVSMFVIELYIFLRTLNIGQVWLSSLMGGLATASLSSYLTAVLINRSFRQQEQERQEQMKNTAYADLRIPIQDHIRLLIEIYIATSEKYPTQQATDYSEFFDNEFINQIQYLEFTQRYPIVREETSWRKHIGEQMKIFQNEVDKNISQYAAWYDPEMVETLRQIRSSTFVSMPIRMVDAGMFGTYNSNNRNPRRMFEEMSNRIPPHLDLLLEIVNKSQENGGFDLQELNDFDVWEPTIAPSLGCGRQDIRTKHPSRQSIQVYPGDINMRQLSTGGNIPNHY